MCNKMARVLEGGVNTAPSDEQRRLREVAPLMRLVAARWHQQTVDLALSWQSDPDADPHLVDLRQQSHTLTAAANAIDTMTGENSDVLARAERILTGRATGEAQPNFCQCADYQIDLEPPFRDRRLTPDD